MVTRQFSGPTRPGTDVARFRSTGESRPSGGGGGGGGRVSGPVRPGRDEEIFRTTGISVESGSAEAGRIRTQQAETKRQADITFAQFQAGQTLQAQAGTLAGQLMQAQAQFAVTGQVQELGEINQLSTPSEIISRQLAGARERFRDTGQVQELGQKELLPGEGGGGFFGRQVSLAKEFFDTPTLIPTGFTGGGITTTPITTFTDRLKESESPILRGTGAGLEAVAGTPKEIFKTTIPFAIGGAFSLAGRGGAFLLSRTTPTIARAGAQIGKGIAVGLGGAFVVERGITFSRTETAEEKGAFIAETGVGLGAFIGGAKVFRGKAPPKLKPDRKPEDVVFLASEQDIGSTGLIQTRLRFETSGGRRGVAESVTIPVGKEGETALFTTFTKGTTTKNILEVPGGIKEVPDVKFEGIIGGGARTGRATISRETGIEGVSESLLSTDFSATFASGRTRPSGGKVVEDFTTGGATIRVGDFSFSRGLVTTKEGTAGFQGITGKLFESEIIPLSLRAKLPKQKIPPGVVKDVPTSVTSGALDLALVQTQAGVTGALPPPPTPKQTTTLPALWLGLQSAVGGLGLALEQLPRPSIIGGVVQDAVVRSRSSLSRGLIQDFSPSLETDIQGKLETVSVIQPPISKIKDRGLISILEPLSDIRQDTRTRTDIQPRIQPPESILRIPPPGLILVQELLAPQRQVPQRPTPPPITPLLGRPTIPPIVPFFLLPSVGRSLGVGGIKAGKRRVGFTPGFIESALDITGDIGAARQRIGSPVQALFARPIAPSKKKSKKKDKKKRRDTIPSLF